MEVVIAVAYNSQGAAGCLFDRCRAERGTPTAHQGGSVSVWECSAACFEDIINSSTSAHISTLRNEKQPPANASR